MQENREGWYMILKVFSLIDICSQEVQKKSLHYLTLVSPHKVVEFCSGLFSTTQTKIGPKTFINGFEGRREECKP